MPPSLLRYSDEQTIAGTAAVFAAIEAMGLPRDEFEGWGVVAASRYLGRANLAVALRSFMAEGVWGTSPHLIPHFALHSPSGTISLALGSHGPNLGVGGGLHAAAEGFLAALTWLAAGVVPGVWLVLSGWSPELVPDPRGNAPAAGECQALALALVAAGIEAGGRCSGSSSGRSRTTRPLRSTWRGWRRRSGERGESGRPGRSRPIRGGGCVSSWSTGRMARDEAKWKRLNRSGSRAWGPRPRSAASSRRSRRTCWPGGRACRW